MAGRFVSPDELMQAAKEQMLNGNEPNSRDDWYLIVNFIAFNMDDELAEQICLVMKSLYDIPLMDEEIKHIVAHQVKRDSERSSR